jgi:hypothetical protein
LLSGALPHGVCSKKRLHVGPNWILQLLGTLYFKIMLTRGTKVGLRRCWPGENTYMWDPKKFYDDLEHYFWKMLTCGTQLNFMMTWNTTFKIMLTCRTKAGLWHYYGAYGITKQAWNRECSAKVATVMMKVFCH